MKNKKIFFACCLIANILSGCSRKTAPSATVNADSHSAAKKTAVAPKAKVPIPKVIVVNDGAAQKTVDGRYYYDLNGRRYWRNNKDGKYYLFNKSMYNNEAFKPVKAN